MFGHNVRNLSKIFVRNNHWKRCGSTFACSKFELHHLDKGPAAQVELTKEQGLKMYDQMITIRGMENGLATLYKEKVARGFCHLYNGQEAIAIGIFNRMRDQDALITSYRAHGFAYLFSGNIPGVMAELAGYEIGVSRGKGGSMHVYAPRFYGGNGIVGSQVPLGTGLALALKYKGTDGVSFTLYGDGAANQGQVFEAFNIAKLWNLPVIYVCENNLYGMGTASTRSSASPNYYQNCHWLPGVLVDGMDAISVLSAVSFAMKHIKDGKGPIILEMRTYRYFGHSMSDPGSSYRSREEIAKVRKTRDPVKTFEAKLLANGYGSAETFKAMNKTIKNKIKDVIKIVKASKDPPMDHLTWDISKGHIEKQVRGITPFAVHQHKNLGPPK